MELFVVILGVVRRDMGEVLLVIRIWVVFILVILVLERFKFYILEVGVG